MQGAFTVLEAAKAIGASQFILVSPLGGASPAGFPLFGKKSSAAKADGQLSRLEQEVATPPAPQSVLGELAPC